MLPDFLSLPTPSHWNNLRQHPRLFADASALNCLRDRNDPVSKNLLTLLMREAEQHLLSPPIHYPTRGFILFEMREVQSRILCLALAFRLTRDSRFLAKSRDELMSLAALQDWGRSHFLDVAEAVLAAAVGFDWLYDELTSIEKDLLANAIVHRAILPSLEVEDQPGSWLRGDFNWTQVCHCGVVVGALAIADREPQLARQVVERAVTHFDQVGLSYSPDGSCAEGPCYWAYGTTFHVILIEALRSALGTSCGLELFSGFLNTHVFRTQVVGPTGQDFDFADYHVENFNEPLFFWFARELLDKQLARPERINLQKMLAAVDSSSAGDEKTIVVTRFTPFGLLWWDPSLPASNNSPLLHWTAGGTLPIAVIRSVWDDPNASFIAIKGGSPNHSHGHMDAGSFIFEAGGVRWAIDLGTENYDKMRAAGIDLWNYQQLSTRWNTFRVGPEGHNILRFDHGPQNINGCATITIAPHDNGAIGNIADLTSIYQPHVLAVHRTVKLLSDGSIAVLDQWSTGDQPVVASFQWLTRAMVSQHGNQIQLQQNGRLLNVLIKSSPGNIGIEIEDVSTARAPQDSPNPALKRITIRTPTPPNTSANLSVKTWVDH